MVGQDAGTHPVLRQADDNNRVLRPVALYRFEQIAALPSCMEKSP